MSLLVENVTIGSDIEFLLYDEKEHELVSAEPYIPGSKHEPHKFMPGNPYWAMQLDNVLAEGNIPPTTSADEFDKYLQFLRTHIDKTLPENIRTVTHGGGMFRKKYLETENAKTFGCDPSISCWNDEPIPVDSANAGSYRSAGFHIHIGYSNILGSTNRKLAAACDLFLAVPAVLSISSSSLEKSRISLGYGLAGNYRHQPHGVEYRTLSSALAGSPGLRKWVFNQTHEAIKFVNDGRVTRDFVRTYASSIQRAINSMEPATALSLCRVFDIRRYS